MVLTLGAILVVVLVPTDSAIREAALVVVGVLVTFILLPDEPHRLWNVDAKALAETVPRERLVEASREVARALATQAGGPVSAETVSDVWDTTLGDLGTIIADPMKVVTDLDYRILVTPDGGRPSLVRTIISAKRCVPRTTNGEVWFSFCSDAESLDNEFAEQGNGCIGRDIIDVAANESIDEWERRVRSYVVEFVIEGHSVLEQRRDRLTLSNGRSRALRIYFKVGGLLSRFVQTDLTVEFHLASTIHRFPVKFSSYYVVGPTHVTFEVGGRDAVVHYDEYFSSSMRRVTVTPCDGLRSRGYTLRAEQSTVLPPGSGAVFHWTSASGGLLNEPPDSLYELLPPGEALLSPGGLPAARPECENVQEPLVPVIGLAVRDAYGELGILPPRELRLREGVLKRLKAAEAALPEDMSLLVLDAWRTLDEQRLLVSHYAELGPTEGFVATVDPQKMRPPHTTGGAVDLTLAWRGSPLMLGTGFDSFTEGAAAAAFEHADSVTRRLRRVLAKAMSDQGFVVYPLEWWHWSYGDDVWAQANGCAALYEIVEHWS
jgi:zinc D-Ala-D-Ala dipeptidase